MNVEYTNVAGAELITLTNKAGLSVTLSDVGAGIRDITYMGVSMMVTPKDPEVYLGHNGGYYGKSIGPVAGRIQNGVYSVNGKRYAFPANEGKNCLHGSVMDYSLRKFKMELCRQENGTSVVFSLRDDSVEGVYPAEVSVVIRYKLLEEEPVLKLRQLASPSVDAPLNLSNHSYWNPGAEDTILDDTLFLKSSRAMSYSLDLIPQGLVPVSKALDFRTPHKVGDYINEEELHKTRTNGYDHCFAIDEHKKDEAILRLEGSSFGMEIFTDAPALQIYSLNYPHDNFPLSNGKVEQQNSGLAIEPVKVAGPAENFIVKGKGEFLYHTTYRFFKK